MSPNTTLANEEQLPFLSASMASHKPAKDGSGTQDEKRTARCLPLPFHVDREPRIFHLVFVGCIVLLWLVLAGTTSSGAVLRLAQSMYLLRNTKAWNTIPAASDDKNMPQFLPPPADEDTDAIPAIIHQTWYNDSIPARWQKAVSSCRDNHPEYQYMFWNHTTMEQFVVENYPEMMDTYLSYPNEIQRCDSFRYMVLHTYGGFYMDLDVACQASLDGFRSRTPFVLGQTFPWGFSNMFLAAVPKSPFFKEIIRSLPGSSGLRNLPNYFYVILSTGSMHISLVWAKMKLAGDLPGRESGWIIPRGIFAGSSLFHHFPGGSWQGQADTLFCRIHDLMVWIQGHQSLFWFLVVAALALCSAAFPLALIYSKVASRSKNE